MGRCTWVGAERLLHEVKSPTGDTENERQDDAPGGPGLLDATSDERVEYGDRGWDEDRCAEIIDTRKRVGPTWVALTIDLEQKDHNDKSQYGDGDIEVENPAPVLLCYGATNDWADCGAYASGRENGSKVWSTIAWRNEVADDDI